MVPYFCVAAMIGLLLEGGAALWIACPGAVLPLAGYAGKALFSTWSTSLSHTATYHTLRRVRQNLLSKLSRVPMGDDPGHALRPVQTTIVDRVEGMEPTLAHLLPEMTSNLLVPVSIAVYIFVLDWRMGLASLVTTVIGFGSLPEWQDSRCPLAGAPWRWALGKCHRGVCGGIQVVKAFSQSAGSYKRYSDAVTENAQYYVDWMADNQKYMAVMQAVIPLGAAARPASGTAAVGQRKPEHRRIPHHRRAVPGAYRSSGISHDLCGRIGGGGYQCG